MSSNVVQAYTIKMEVPENAENEYGITLEDFPFICRACLGRSDLRLFEEEYCLLDLFLMLTKIQDNSSVNFPKNVCDSCINTLEDISLFIDISRYNNPIFMEKMLAIKVEELSIRIPEETILQGRSKYCRACLCTRNLSPFEDKPELLQLFQECTQIYVKDITNYWKVNSICDTCTYELQKASLFISLSVRNNRIIQRLTTVDIKEEMLDDDMYMHPNIIVKEDVFDDGSGKSPIETETCEDLHTSLNIKQEVFDDTFIICPSSRFQSKIVSFDRTHPEEKSFEKSLGQNETSIKTDSHKSLEHISEKILEPSKQTLKCNHCEKSFCRNYLLQRHISTHTGEKPHTCVHCGKYFSLKTSLKRHLLICGNKNSIPKGNLQSEYNLRDHSLGWRGINSTQKEKQYTAVIKNEKPSKCNLFEKSFEKGIQLKGHLLTNTEESLLKCNSCDYSSKWKYNLQRHSLNCSKMNSAQDEKQNYATHEDENPFKCDICEKSFSKNCSLKRHSVTHTEESPFKCKSCDYSSKWKYNLERHSMHCTTRKDEKPFKCNSCDFSSKWNQSLQRHSMTCTMTKSTQKGIRQQHLRTKNMQEHTTCKTKKKFSREFLLKQHLHTHSKQRPFNCQDCNCHFKWSSNLRRHSLICSKMSSTRKKNLQQHSTVRKNKKVLTCTTCGKRFLDKYIFGRHLLSHSEERPFKCNRCDFSTKWLYNLQRHSLAHTKKSSFKCNSCDHSFKWKQNLQRHSLNCSKIYSAQADKQNSTFPRDENPFKCDICKKSFRQKLSLKRHSLTHTEELPFNCKSCDFSSKWKHNLQRHLLNCTLRKSNQNDIRQEPSRTRNMQEPSTTKALKCTICKKNFRFPFLLKRHMLTHSEERPFKCQGCNFQFRWNSNLRRHILICSKMSSTRKENLKEHSIVRRDGEGLK